MLKAATRKHNASNPEGFAVHFYMGHDLRHDALAVRDFGQNKKLKRVALVMKEET
ncbi:MAG: hypothetical protein J4F29_15495 [Candidatus Latescibacteria bacterium]|nr:hypothetical protein [Candidatus Latescibacterota bacterium]